MDIRVEGACALAFAGFLLCGLAAAQETTGDDGKAKAAFEEGKSLYHEGKYREAGEKFREAYARKPSWKLEYNIGQCEAMAKDYGRALEAFELYLADGGDEVPADRREEVLSELRRLRDMVGDLKVKGRDGLDVEVDGAMRGRTPLPGPVPISAGLTHDVRLLSGGKAILSTRVLVRGGASTEIEAPVGGLAAPEIARAPAKPARPSKPASSEPAQAGAQAGEGGLSPTYFWVALGATAALGAGTVGLGVATDSKVSDVKKSPDDQGLRDDAKAMQAGAYALLGLTGAAAVTTVVLVLFTDFGGSGKGGEASLSIAPAPGGLVLEGRF
ncbi:MAG: tetratricopeptide repeat protein [Deltaproteobacteria bacterium]|nr:tetratricopeptide repeat protein [Deltaproteobacteria bacterium]